MPTFEQGDVVRVPFPYADRDTRQRRPALVVSAGPTGEENQLLWVAMITSAENKAWTGDVLIPNHQKAGLPVLSRIRPVKIATIEAKHADPIGKVGDKTRQDVMRRVRTILQGLGGH